MQDTGTHTPNLHEALAQVAAALASLAQALAPTSPQPGPSLSRTPAPKALARVTLKEACRRYLDAKESAGCTERHLRHVRHYLERLCGSGRGARPVDDITPEEVESWSCGQGWSTRTRKGALTDIRALLTWSFRRGLAGRDIGKTLEIPKPKPAGVGIHTPAQVEQILHTARGVRSDCALHLALRYFGGLRTSEALALDWSMVHLDRGFIEVPASIAKTRRRRLVTIQPALRAWIDMGGEMPLRDANTQLAKVTRLAGLPWPRNAPRHSWVSYHLAEFKSAAQTALEAGHSEAMLFSVYRELVTPEASKAFWAIRPR